MSLEISFANKQLREICENETVAKEVYGDLCAKKLFSRLSDLRASETIYDVLAGNPTKVNALEISITLDNKSKLIITANHISNPLTDKNEIDWDRVSRIKIIDIERGGSDAK